MGIDLDGDHREVLDVQVDADGDQVRVEPALAPSGQP
jgi:hypothetical protein